MNTSVFAAAVFDDGSGPTLYAAGYFQRASGSPASRIARWSGERWEEVGGGVNGTVNAMSVFDDGTGPALYVAGEFTSAGGEPAAHIAKWDGSQWSALGNGLNDHVRDLIVFDDGTGPALYAGGEFTHSGEELIRFVAKWDGMTWSALPDGPSGDVYELEVFDDGNGTALYLGGRFVLAGGITVNRIARWDGETWSALGAGIGPMIAVAVNAMAVFDDGSGPALFVGGNFSFAGGQSAPHIAKWDGVDWFPLPATTDAPIIQLRTIDLGDGAALYAGGDFDAAGNVSTRGIARWNGVHWTSVGRNGGINGVMTDMLRYDIDGEPAIIVTGSFKRAGGLDVNFIAKLEGEQWDSIGSLGTTLDGRVDALETFDDGTGSRLFAAGAFTRAGGRVMERIAQWDGSSWSYVSEGPNGVVADFQVYDDGNGPALYAAGTFTSIGGISAGRIARWDGQQWSTVGGPEGFDDTVSNLKVFDDGSGPMLYAGGEFQSIDGTPVSRIARWDGRKWSSVGDGLKGLFAAYMVVHDDGNGSALYVGGYFQKAGSTETMSIARWDGKKWTALGSGIDGGVYAMTVADLGNGPELYAGGYFDSAGGKPARNIAKWDGTEWTPLDAGVGNSVTDLIEFNDGTGNALYVGGSFTFVGGKYMPHLAKWSDVGWTDITEQQRLNRVIWALHIHDDGTGPALFIGGRFDESPSGDRFIAKYQGCGPTTSPAPLTDFSITLGTLLDGGLDELIDSDDSYLRARSQFGFSAEEPNVLELRAGAISPTVDASTIAATIESRLNHPNGAASVRLRNWNTNEFDEVHVYTIGTVEIIETIEGIDAANYIRATDGRIELAHRQVVLATFSALGFDAAIDQVEVIVTE